MIFLICILCNSLVGQDQDSSIERTLLEHLKEKSKYENIEEVSSEIVHSNMSEVEKTKAIFNWVTHNIKYDCKRRNKSQKLNRKNSKLKKKGKKKRKTLESLQPIEVVNRAKGICSDYSILFDKLCSVNGIKSEIISGYARNERKKIGRPFRANHAWNRVYLNGEVYYVDATWSSGYSVDDCKKFYHQPDTSYMLVNTNRFRFDHFQNSSKKDSIFIATKKNFFKYPHIEKGFFTNEIDDFYPREGIIKMKLDSTLNIKIFCKKPISHYRVYSEKGELNKVGELIRVEDYFRIDFQPNKTGFQYLNIVINDRAILTYKVYVRK